MIRVLVAAFALASCGALVACGSDGGGDGGSKGDADSASSTSRFAAGPAATIGPPSLGFTCAL